MQDHDDVAGLELVLPSPFLGQIAPNGSMRGKRLRKQCEIALVLVE